MYQEFDVELEILETEAKNNENKKDNSGDFKNRCGSELVYPQTIDKDTNNRNLADKTEQEYKMKDKFPEVDLTDIEGKFDLGDSASASDCTGLISVGLPDEAELESYSEVYNFGAPNVKDE